MSLGSVDPPLLTAPTLLDVGNETRFYKLVSGARHCMALGSGLTVLAPSTYTLNIWGGNSGMFYFWYIYYF